MGYNFTYGGTANKLWFLLKVQKLTSAYLTLTRDSVKWQGCLKHMLTFVPNSFHEYVWGRKIWKLACFCFTSKVQKMKWLEEINRRHFINILICCMDQFCQTGRSTDHGELWQIKMDDWQNGIAKNNVGILDPLVFKPHECYIMEMVSFHR